MHLFAEHRRRRHALSNALRSSSGSSLIARYSAARLGAIKLLQYLRPAGVKRTVLTRRSPSASPSSTNHAPQTMR